MNLCQRTYCQNDVASGFAGGYPQTGNNRGGVLSVIGLWLLYMRAAVQGIWSAGERINERPPAQTYTVNRRTRRTPRRDGPVSLRLDGFEKLLGRNLTRTQFLERLCAISVNGRIIIYLMPYWPVKLWGRRFYALPFSGETRIHTQRPPPAVSDLKSYKTIAARRTALYKGLRFGRASKDIFMTFAPGDIVRLKSGGPKMTVLTVEGDAAECKWFDRNGKLHSDQFAAALLDAFIPRTPDPV